MGVYSYLSCYVNVFPAPVWVAGLLYAELAAEL